MLKRIRTLFRKANDDHGNDPQPADEPGRRADAAPDQSVHQGPSIVHRPIAASDLDDDAVKIIARLTRFDHKAYLVGGCVRDLLLERSPKDFDIATSATPRQIKRLFRNCRIIGRRFRLAHIYFHGGKIIEVATFRALEEARPGDGDDDDLMIRDDNVFGSPEDDALRRDFTVNALFYDVADGNVIDHVDGLSDLRRRVIHTIGEPEIRFREDPIRMLRAIKFAARLDFEIEPATRAAIEAVCDEIPKAAAPRITEELHRFFREGAARRAFNLLLDTGVLQVLLPELTRELTADPARRELVGALLAAADQRRTDDQEPRMGAMFAALLLPIVAEPFGWHTDGTTDPPKRINPRQIIDRRLAPIAERLRIPRREQEHCRQALMSLARMAPADRVRRAALRSILTRESRDDSMALLAVLAEAWGGQFVDALAFWRRAIDEGDLPGARDGSTRDDQADAADLIDDGELTDDEGTSAPRPRRSRGGRRRRGKRGGARARGDNEPAGGDADDGTTDADAPAPARAPAKAKTKTKAPAGNMPSPWDDQYFFAALPTVPEPGSKNPEARAPRRDAPEPDEPSTSSGSAARGDGADDDDKSPAADRPRRRRSRGGRRRRGGARRSESVTEGSGDNGGNGGGDSDDRGEP